MSDSKEHQIDYSSLKFEVNPLFSEAHGGYVVECEYEEGDFYCMFWLDLSGNIVERYSSNLVYSKEKAEKILMNYEEDRILKKPKIKQKDRAEMKDLTFVSNAILQKAIERTAKYNKSLSLFVLVLGFLNFWFFCLSFIFMETSTLKYSILIFCASAFGNLMGLRIGSYSGADQAFDYFKLEHRNFLDLILKKPIEKE